MPELLPFIHPALMLLAGALSLAALARRGRRPA
jgi:hypothetical protein